MCAKLNEIEKERFVAYQLHLTGKSNSFIAKKFKKSVQWVQKNTKRVNETGKFEDRVRSGRPRKVTSRDQSRLVKAVQGKRGQSLRKTSRSFRTLKGEKLSPSTIRTTLRRAKMYPHRRRKVTALTDGQKIRRVEFARKYRRFDWTKCVFWDETVFTLFSTPNLKNDITWDAKGVAFNYEKQAHPKTFCFGAAITVNGPTRIIPYRGIIEQDSYVEMVRKVLPDLNSLMKGIDWTFVQDGARPHTARRTVVTLTDEFPHLFPASDWPPNSPDDNPIENVFGYLDSQIGPKSYATEKALEAGIRNAWKKLTPEYCRNCIESIPSRLTQIIATKGEYIYKVNKHK